MFKASISKPEQLQFSPQISGLRLTAGICTCSEMKYLADEVFSLQN